MVRKLKQFATFGGVQYNRHGSSYPTKEDVVRKAKKLKGKGFRVVRDKNSEGHFLWTQKTTWPPSKKVPAKKPKAKPKAKPKPKYEQPWVSKFEPYLSEGKKPKAKPVDIIKKNQEKVDREVLKAMSSGRGIGMKTIRGKLDYNETTILKSINRLKIKGKIIQEKKYKPHPSGKGLSRSYDWKFKIKPKEMLPLPHY
jgi:hypothetical protein